MIKAHDALQEAGFKRCNQTSPYGCYVNRLAGGAPASHYHFERPPDSWPAWTWFRGEKVPTDPELDFLELETLRLYVAEDTLWDLNNYWEVRSSWSDVMDASDRDIQQGS